MGSYIVTLQYFFSCRVMIIVSLIFFISCVSLLSTISHFQQTNKSEQKRFEKKNKDKYRTPPHFFFCGGLFKKTWMAHKKKNFLDGPVQVRTDFSRLSVLQLFGQNGYTYGPISYVCLSVLSFFCGDDRVHVRDRFLRHGSTYGPISHVCLSVLSFFGGGTTDPVHDVRNDFLRSCVSSFFYGFTYGPISHRRGYTYGHRFPTFLFLVWDRGSPQNLGHLPCFFPLTPFWQLQTIRATCVKAIQTNEVDDTERARFQHDPKWFSLVSIALQPYQPACIQGESGDWIYFSMLFSNLFVICAKPHIMFSFFNIHDLLNVYCVDTVDNK